MCEFCILHSLSSENPHELEIMVQGHQRWYGPVKFQGGNFLLSPGNLEF